VESFLARGSPAEPAGLKDLEVVSFADGVTPDEAGLGEGASPTAVLELRLSGREAPHVYRIGRVLENGDAYLRRNDEPAVVVAPALCLELLRSPWFRFRDREVQKVPRVEVRSIEVDRGERHEAVVRKGNEWAPGEGAEGKVVAANVMDLLVTFEPLLAADFVERLPSGEAVDLSPWGLDRPAVRIRLTLGEGEKARELTLLVGPAEEGKPHPAKLVGAGDSVDALVFTLRPVAWEALDKPLLE
jgi:hypothetical protein